MGMKGNNLKPTCPGCGAEMELHTFSNGPKSNKEFQAFICPNRPTEEHPYGCDFDGLVPKSDLEGKTQDEIHSILRQHLYACLRAKKLYEDTLWYSDFGDEYKTEASSEMTNPDVMRMEGAD